MAALREQAPALAYTPGCIPRSALRGAAIRYQPKPVRRV